MFIGNLQAAIVKGGLTACASPAPRSAAERRQVQARVGHAQLSILQHLFQLPLNGYSKPAAETHHVREVDG
jgi:hypothetical protein